MGDFLGIFVKGVKGGVRALLTPITSRKRPRPAEVVDEVVPDDRDERPAKRRLAMGVEEIQAEDSTNAAHRDGGMNRRLPFVTAPAQHQVAIPQQMQSPAIRPRPWPRYQLNGGAPADPFPAGPVLPLSQHRGREPLRPSADSPFVRHDAAGGATEDDPAAAPANGQDTAQVAHDKGLHKPQEPQQGAGPSSLVPGEVRNRGAQTATPPWRWRLPHPDAIHADGQQRAGAGGRANFRGSSFLGGRRREVAAAGQGGGGGNDEVVGFSPSLPTPNQQPLLNTAVRHRLDMFGRAAVAGLPESLRRAAGVDLRAKQAYAEQLQARGGGGVSTAAEATARTVCARCLQDPVSDTGCPGTAEADSAVVDLTRADSPSPAQRDDKSPAMQATQLATADGASPWLIARVPPAPDVSASMRLTVPPLTDAVAAAMARDEEMPALEAAHAAESVTRQELRIKADEDAQEAKRRAQNAIDGPEALAFLERLRSLGFSAPAPPRVTPLLGRDRAAMEVLELQDRKKRLAATRAAIEERKTAAAAAAVGKRTAKRPAQRRRPTGAESRHEGEDADAAAGKAAATDAVELSSDSEASEEAASRVDGEEDALSRDMGSVAVSDADESSELVSRLELRRYRLSKRELAVYRRAMAPGEPTEVLVSHKQSNIEIRRVEMDSLRGLNWLNDEIMNIYVNLLQERDTRWRKQGDHARVHFFNSFFVGKLIKDQGVYDYKTVRRWTMEKRLKMWGQASASVLDCDLVLAPVHLSMHWTCVAVNLRDQEIVYLDSMGGRDKDVVESLARWVADEYLDKRKEEVDTSSWQRRYLRDIPQQQNGSDCGVFALRYIEALARDAALEFDQSDMPDLRMRMAVEIMQLRVE